MILPRMIFSDCSERKQYTAEASDLIGWTANFEIIIRSDTCEATFKLVSLERSKDEDNEILSWEYRPTPETLERIPRLTDWKVVILND